MDIDIERHLNTDAYVNRNIDIDVDMAIDGSIDTNICI